MFVFVLLVVFVVFVDSGSVVCICCSVSMLSTKGMPPLIICCSPAVSFSLPLVSTFVSILPSLLVSLLMVIASASSGAACVKRSARSGHFSSSWPASERKHCSYQNNITENENE